MLNRIMICGVLVACLAIPLAACGDDDGGGGHVQYEPMCQAMYNAGCQPSVGDCTSAFTNAASHGCEASVSTLVDCAGDAPTASCHPSGVPIIDGCESESAEAILCATGG